MGNHSAWGLTYTKDRCIEPSEPECSGVMVRGSHCESRKDWLGQRAPVQAKDNLKEVLAMSAKRTSGPGSYRKVRK